MWGAKVPAAMRAGIPARDLTEAEEQILIDREVPEEFERDISGLADIVRDPLAKPLATLAAALIAATVAYQIAVAALEYHPLVGVAAVATSVVAYAVAKRAWAFQHRFILRELAKEGELDRLRDRRSD